MDHPRRAFDEGDVPGAARRSRGWSDAGHGESTHIPPRRAVVGRRSAGMVDLPPPADPVAARRVSPVRLGERPAPTSESAEPGSPQASPAPPRTSADPVGRTPGPIVVDRLSKSFASRPAVRDLSFTVAPGRITGFLGPNGAGKTTTLRMLVGLARPTSGRATFDGVAYADLPHPQRTVGCVLEASFHPGRSGRDHLRVLAATAQVGDARIDELLRLVGLTDAARQRVGGYSLGMRQRLALAAALLGDPSYLILDEPANGLDPEGIRWLRGFLRDFVSDGRTVLVSSHLLSEVEATVDDIVVINHGRLLRQAEMADLEISDGMTRVRVSDPARARVALAGLGAVEAREDEDGPYLKVRTGDLAAVGNALFAAGLAVWELSRERYDLEEHFFAMLEAGE